jgi:hypothetical protein
VDRFEPSSVMVTDRFAEPLMFVVLVVGGRHQAASSPLP